MGTESPAEAAGRRSTDTRRTCQPREAEPTNDLLPDLRLARFGELGIPRERLVEVGWTKAAVVIENCEPEEMEEALALAETATAKELPALLKGARRRLRPARCSSASPQGNTTNSRPSCWRTALGVRRRGRGLSGKEKALMKALGH